MSSLPLMERVTLHGGPLDGFVRHVPRGATVARLKPPLGDRPDTYRRDEQGVWRHAERLEETAAAGHLAEGQPAAADRKEV